MNVLWDKKNPEKVFKVLSCVIYTIIRNYVCIDYSYFESKKLSELPVGSGGGYKHEGTIYDKIVRIRIPYLLMNLMSCHGFLRNKYPVVVLKFPKIMCEYFISKILTYFDCNNINLEIFQLR